MTDDYQGWSNKETWTANLWIGNDERLYNDARAIALAAGSPFEKVDNLDKRMRREIESHTGFAADMLNAAFARVNWREIVDALAEA